MAALTSLASGLSSINLRDDRTTSSSFSSSSSSSRLLEDIDHGSNSGPLDWLPRLTSAGTQIRQTGMQKWRLLVSARPFLYVMPGRLVLRSSSSDVFRGFVPIPNLPHRRFRSKMARTGAWAFAMEVAEEAQLPSEDTLKSLDSSIFSDSRPMAVPLPPRNRADDASLHNPLLRLERMGCGWLGVIMEWDGVMVEDDGDIERKSWAALAAEEGRRPPPAFVLKRAEGMKSEQAISEVLCWSRDPRQMRRLAQRKEELFQDMQGGIYRLKPGSREFVLTLKKYKTPIALVSTRPKRVVEKAIEAVGMEGFFNVVIAAEDVYRGKPDPEMYMYAAQLLDFIPERCIVFGNSNTSVEAAHDTYMKCVAVAGKHPVFELGAADLVVSKLDNLSLVDLKNLADLDSPEFSPPEPVPEPEFEEMEDPAPRTRVSLYDRW